MPEWWPAEMLLWPLHFPGDAKCPQGWDFPGIPDSPISGPKPAAHGHRMTPAAKQGLALTSPCLLPPCLSPLQKTYRDFRLQGVLDSTLNSKTYETIRNRLTVEEATASVSEGGGLQGITMKDSDEEDEEDD